MKTLWTLTLLSAILFSCIAGTFGHSYVTSPTSRGNQKQTQSGCRGPACLGPCDRVKGASGNTPAVTIQRGAPITVQWPRNNHAGGFIRLAWAAYDQSDSHSAFDAGVQQYSCHEVGCKPSDPSNPLGGDTDGSDGSVDPCFASITVPPHLADGRYTLQWAWYGGAFQLGDYYSCIDYVVSGGPSGPQPSPVFRGGDYTFPGQQKCRFFNTDRLHVCVNEPCSNAGYPTAQPQGGPPAGFGSSGSNQGTTGVQQQAPGTTGVQQAPGTTGVQQAPGTTGVQQAPGTTGVQQVAGTTGVQPAAGTTGVQPGVGSGSVIVPMPSNGACSNQACCDALARPNEDTGVGYLAYNPSACANGGMNCFQNSGCQLCYKSAPQPNNANLPLCPSSKRSADPSQFDDIEENAAGSMRWITVGTFLIWTVFVLLI